jgi:hypothetical protein
MEIVDHLLPCDSQVIDYSDESGPRVDLGKYLTLGTHSFMVAREMPGSCDDNENPSAFLLKV